MVGARGFEPPTPCSQNRCATRLRYAPTKIGAVLHDQDAIGKRINQEKQFFLQIMNLRDYSKEIERS